MYAIRGPSLLAAVLVVASLGASAHDPGTPLPPNNLKIHSAEGENILSWEPPIEDGDEPLEGYNIYSYNGQIQSLLAHVSADVHSFRHSLESATPKGDPSKVIYYWVKALNSKGESPPSNVVSDWDEYPRCTPMGPDHLHCVDPAPCVSICPSPESLIRLVQDSLPPI